MVTAVYDLEQEVGALDLGDGEPCDFVIFNHDRDQDDERTDQVLILDLATWMDLGRPEHLRVTLESA